MRPPVSLRRLDAAVAHAQHDLARQRDEARAAIAAQLAGPPAPTTAPPTAVPESCRLAAAPIGFLPIRRGGCTSTELDRETWFCRALLVGLVAQVLYVFLPDRPAQVQHALMVDAITAMAGIALALLSWMVARMLWDPW